MSQVAIVARVTVKEGKAGQYLAAFAAHATSDVHAAATPVDPGTSALPRFRTMTCARMSASSG